MSRDKRVTGILRRFPTERYKRFYYPTKTLFNLLAGFTLISLGVFHIVPIAWAFYLAAAFALDDLPLTPIMTMITAINNLAEGRKKVKAGVMLIAIVVALVAGALLGWLVLAQSPAIVAALTNYILLSHCSPLLISAGAFLGAYTGHWSRRVSPFIGIFIGITIASFLGTPIPLLVELVFMSALFCALFASIATKQLLRLYYKQTYGHSNADGYERARVPADQLAFIQKQAQILAVTPDEFVALTSFCEKKIKNVKQSTGIINELLGRRNHITNAYKDIYLGLMNPEMNKNDAGVIKNLIMTSKLSPEDNTDANWWSVEFMLLSGRTFFHADVKKRILAHQFKIAEGGGLDDKLTKPFASECFEMTPLRIRY